MSLTCLFACLFVSLEVVIVSVGYPNLYSITHLCIMERPLSNSSSRRISKDMIIFNFSAIKCCNNTVSAMKDNTSGGGVVIRSSISFRYIVAKDDLDISTTGTNVFRGGG